MPMPAGFKRLVTAVYFATVKLLPTGFEADAMLVGVQGNGGEVFVFVHVQIYAFYIILNSVLLYTLSSFFFIHSK